MDHGLEANTNMDGMDDYAPVSSAASASRNNGGADGFGDYSLADSVGSSSAVLPFHG